MPQPTQNQEPTINTPTKPMDFYAPFEKNCLVKSLDLLKHSWVIFSKNWKKYIFLLLWLYAPWVAFGLLATIAIIVLLIVAPAILNTVAKFSLANLSPGVWVILSIAVLITILFFFAYLIFSYVVSFALILHSHQLNQNLSIKELLKQAYKKVWGGIWVNILVGLIVFAGFLLLIVPGIIWSIKYSLATYVYLIEEKKGWLALKRSTEIVKGYWWSILKRYLIWVYFSMGLMLILMFIPVINFFANFATVILTPWGIIYFYSIYRNIKNLKDRGIVSDNYKFKDKALTFLMASGIFIAVIIFGGLMALSSYLSKGGEIDQNNSKNYYYEDKWDYDDWLPDEENLDNYYQYQQEGLENENNQDNEVY